MRVHVGRSAVHIGNVRLQWWIERSTYVPGQWWTVHVTLHRYGMK